MPVLKNAKREAFCQAVVKGMNATKAYIAAGYSEGGAAQSANNLLKNPEISSRISELSVKAVQVMETKFDASVANIVEEFCRVGFLDPAEIFDADGNLLPVREMPKHVRAAIASVEVTSEVAEDGTVSRVSKVKFWSKTTALDSLAKWRRMFAELIERGKPGEFDHLSDEEVDARLQALEAIDKAKDAARLETKTKPAPG